MKTLEHNAQLVAGTRSSEAMDLDGHETSYIDPIRFLLMKQAVGEAWKLFEKTFTSRDCKALTDPSPSDVNELHQGMFFKDLLNNVNIAFCSGTTEPTVTPTTVLFKFEQLGIARPEYWTIQTLAFLTHHAIRAANGLNTNLQRDLSSLLFELLSVWRLFFQCKGRKRGPLETISTEWQIPLTLESFQELQENKDLPLRLQEYHPNFVGSPTLGFCAVYLYNLSETLEASDSLREQAGPFIKLLTHLLAGSNVSSVLKHRELSMDFQSFPEKVQNDIMKEINAAPSKAMIRIGTESVHEKGDAGDPQSNLEQSILKRIARVVVSRESSVGLDNLWKEIVRTYTEKDGKPAIPLSIYNAFLSGYLELLKAQRSVEVWNHMIAHGIKPNMASWVALLEGCEKAKDLDGFNAMWSRMLKSGVEPDIYAWTTRVHGLTALRQINVAMKTLDDMGNRWLSAQKVIDAARTQSKRGKGVKNLPKSATAVNNCTKPTVEVINGAISALVQLPLTNMRPERRIEYVQNILRWAGNFQIKPDARTYNSLMQLYLRMEDYPTAYKVLGQMEKAGIKGDIATHTMLVTAAFDNGAYDKLSGAQQTERILRLFDELESSGLKLNEFIYATAIDRLLKQYSNHTAVRAIIETMEARKLVPSPHIYTSLITYYFQHSPPLISAVDALMNQILTNPRIPNDKYLFDRTIEGYAEHGEVGQMMSVLTRMSKQGKYPSWQAITAVVKALVKAGEVERARLVVRDVGRGEGVAEGGITGSKKGEEFFFTEVRRLGVGLGEERMGDFFVKDRGEQAGKQDFSELGKWKGLRSGHGEGEGKTSILDRESSGSAVVVEEEDLHPFLANEDESQYPRR